MEGDLQSVISQLKNRRDEVGFEPVIYSLKNDKERTALERLISEEKYIVVLDELRGQLKELVKARHPKQQSFTQGEIDDLIKAHLNGIEEYDYGCWVYYPWNKNVIHLLPEDEFIEVRTNRNRNKITLTESELLHQKKVGVIGLSVGQSVSVTMAMERSFGEIRLADFDKLELTNLNRIRTGLANLGLSKVVSVAREIKEIDPFLKVVAYSEGITEENIDQFCTEGGKLDAIIDECDGLDIKVLCRIKAREYQIPVLMEASDRGTIDVERFDLEPKRPLLHGFIDHLDLSKIKGLKTNEEKVPYLLPIAGIETLSKKMKASMLEISQTLTTWPQLSSAVTLGGGITADTYRRIMLNEFSSSGRFFVDTEDILKDQDKVVERDNGLTELPLPLTREEVEKIVSNLHLNGQESGGISEELAKEFVAAAVMAPSGGNNQPWKWKFNNGSLLLLHDRVRSVSFSDFGDIAAMIALGASIENLAIKAFSAGYTAKIDLFPKKEEKRLVARITFTEGTDDQEQFQIQSRGLDEYIYERHTNRQKSGYTKLEDFVLEQLRSIVPVDSGMKLITITSREDIKEMAQIVSACERIRIMHPEGHRDFYEQEVRWTDKESRETGDGIDIATIELTPSEMAGMKLASDPEVMHYLRKWNGGAGFEKLSREGVETCSAIGLVRVPGFDYKNFVQGGRIVQRVWLQATALGLSVHPVSAGLFMFARLFRGKGEGLSARQQAEIGRLYETFKNIVPNAGDLTNLFMFRIFKGERPVVKSYRRPFEDVYM